MKIQSVKDDAFKPYGRIVDGYDYKLLLERLKSETEKPADGVIYEPTCKALEDTPAFAQLRDNCYGGMPIEIGYCNGTNTKLNCFEYHRDNEINIAADDAILLVAKLQDVENGIIDSSKTEAFLCPKGTAVEVYSTTLHYAPCSAKKGEGFRVAIVLPRETNFDMPNITKANSEDAYLWAKNKWLIAHKDTAEAKAGAHVGITGENIDISDLI